MNHVTEMAHATIQDAIQAAIHRIEHLSIENDALRRCARLIHGRHYMASGSLEMQECDLACKAVGLEPWKWPLGRK
jgi:hypothetical protein